jgi:hypothetical protein
MACHIAAAAIGPGARRRVPKMTKKERTSINNGIWLCYYHGKLIDTDEHRFTIPMLKEWREISEFRAQWAQEHGKECPMPPRLLRARFGFAEQALRFRGVTHLNERIGAAFADCCIELIWAGEMARVVRDVVIEIIRNALTHGKAKQCIVVIRQGAIYVADNGLDFSCLELEKHPKGRGGAAAIRHLLNEFGNDLFLGAKRENSRNITIFARSHDSKALRFMQPCIVGLNEDDVDQLKKDEIPPVLLARRLKPCRVVHVLLPPFSTPSDVYTLHEKLLLPASSLSKKQFVFVTSQTSSFVCDTIAELFPNCRVVEM